jgi:penicillin-binding protein
VLELKADQAFSIWKPQAVPSEHVPTLTAILREVVDNPAGTGYTKTPTVAKLLGKTGTAELKKSAADTTAQENGWFVAMNVEDPRLTVAMLIEDVKGRGGSHYVVPLVKNVMDDLLK